MWICPACGEPHQDQFKECWKCVGNESDPHAIEAPPHPAPGQESRQLRPLAAVLFRMAVGFGLALLVVVAFLQRRGTPLMDATLVGASVGLSAALFVGFLFWVAFPFQPKREPMESTDDVK